MGQCLARRAGISFGEAFVLEDDLELELVELWMIIASAC
jgi:hypothetical protein